MYESFHGYQCFCLRFSCPGFFLLHIYWKVPFFFFKTVKIDVKQFQMDNYTDIMSAGIVLMNKLKRNNLV